MLSTKGYAALAAGAALRPFSFDRHDVGASDVLIAISHCGICHTDIHGGLKIQVQRVNDTAAV